MIAPDLDRRRMVLVHSLIFTMLLVTLANYFTSTHPNDSMLSNSPLGESRNVAAAVHAAAALKKSLATVDKSTKELVINGKFIASNSAISNTLPRHLGTLADPSPKKIKVRLYMESKCPSCKKFTRYYLSKILEADGVSKIETLVPAKSLKVDLRADVGHHRLQICSMGQWPNCKGWNRIQYYISTCCSPRSGIFEEVDHGSRALHETMSLSSH